jgi:hypothetical protein
MWISDRCNISFETHSVAKLDSTYMTIVFVIERILPNAPFDDGPVVCMDDRETQDMLFCAFEAKVNTLLFK